MNNKGFTLLELLVVVSVLGIITLLAVPAYNTVSSSVRENHRNNIISEIEIAASKYAYDTNETIIFVDTLVTNGYIESDDEDGNIYDPVNNERMNCYIVEMEKVSDYYTATFIDGNNYDEDGVCDTSKLASASGGVSVQVLNDGNIITDTTNWLTGIVTLEAYSNTLYINCAVNKCVWTSSSGASYTGVSEIDIDNVSGILSTTYTFQYTVYDDTDDTIKRYTVSVPLKIDNDSPEIYTNEITVTNRYIYTSSKNVTISASDGNGSGIAGYYLAIDTGQLCNSTALENSYQEGKTFKITENGSYLICVKDNVGNISTYSGLTINYIS